ncbi:MAG TPA: type II toxin-antitoxin system prevent-host-death family antitoxin [Dyella sp.]|jgi:antitoxin YefM
MRVISFSDARNNLKGVLDTVASDCAITVIHRRDHEDAVVMSLADYNSMADTIHLMSSKKNREHLAKSIAQFKAGKAKKRELVEEEKSEEGETT